VIGGALALIALFVVGFFWPALKSDWDYRHAKRSFARLHVGDTKAKVETVFGRPPFTQDTDTCWYDHETRWPGGDRVFTVCFDHGRLASKSSSDE
jgi:hypothetical protein